MSDYMRITRAIEFITANASNQPTLEAIAAHLHLSPFHFQRLFCRWTGVTPKRYLQTLTVERAKRLLAQARPLLQVSESVGLSSSSRLHDHFVQLEAVTPGEYKQRGTNLHIEHGVCASPFGGLFVAITSRGICKLSFVDDAAETPELVTELRRCWPRATLRANPAAAQAVAAALFSRRPRPDRPLSLYVKGTNFQVSVWRALLRIPPAAVVSYTEVAEAVARPRAARAVGSAIGANPAAFLIPCHRVIQQSGRLGGYHWGETRLQAIHAWECARAETRGGQEIPD